MLVVNYKTNFKYFMTACLSSKVVESKKVSQIYVPDIFQEGPTDSFTETLFRLVRLSKS